MKSIKKPIFFIIAACILIFSVLTTFGISTYYGDVRTIIIKGVNDIRWGIDIRGGVDVTFTPPDDYEGEITEVELDAARSTIELRMIAKNITDYEIYTDYGSQRIIVRFPWQSGDSSFDPEIAVKELGEMAELAFYEGMEREGTPVLTGRDVNKATAYFVPGQNGAAGEHGVALELKDSGKDAFSDATSRLMGSEEVISIWMDDIRISYPRVNSHISDGRAQITGSFDRESAVDLANKINGGALPFKVVTDSFSIIDPTMGLHARNAMALAGIIAFVIMCAFMISRYRILGAVATLGLAGQLFGSLAVISGFFGGFDSFTLTIPGIAGIILSIGMGVDANVITAERIKEEIRSGKTLNGAVQTGYKRAFSAILDGNLTMFIVAFILMGAFGPPDSFASTVLAVIFRWFGPSAAGSIYAFGYTLIIGVILNFIFGVFAARLMTYSLVKFKALQNPVLYGGYKNDAQREKEESKKPFDAVGNRNKFLAAPIAVVAVAVSLMLIIGLEVAIEFRGGTILNYTYNGEIDANSVKTLIESDETGSVNIKLGTAYGSEAKTMNIEFSSKKGLTSDVQHGISQSLENEFADYDLALSGSQDVNPTMGKAFFLKCLVAVLVSFIVLLLYIALRFKNVGGWSSGVFAIVALLINVLIVFSVFVFFRFPIDANFMAVVLTILCYTINDTIVVFDRIRENRNLYGKRLSYKELVNKSVSQSFTRSLNTTITTSIAMLVVCIVAVITGIGSMLSFALPLLLGLGFGFVTSLFISGPLWAMWRSSRE
ncbi:MAG: protein translocase subunit SecF [Oscillospiraceae bacterium]|nr:protein translocase subunit SecF [Oscillospiraceae bacterium]